METIGAEVGQKMRSAIKAKLMELGCYVDDELPDYIMVMVANRRTRTQMDKDLQLFLRTNTKVFVDWLQKVLKKLEEVTVTNPEAYVSSSAELKRKSTVDIADSAIKKKALPPKSDRIVTLEPEPSNVSTTRCLTDDLPVRAGELLEIHKARISERKINDAPKLDDSNKSDDANKSDDDLQEMEAQLLKAKKKLESMESDSEDDDFINIKADAEELGTELNYMGVTTAKVNQSPDKPVVDLRDLLPTRKQTMPYVPPSDTEFVYVGWKGRPKKVNLTESAREEKEIKSKYQPIYLTVNRYLPERQDALHNHRVAMPVSIVSKPIRKEMPAPKSPVHAVPSVVQVKSRKPPPKSCQANKNLLLKAVAEAQKSVIQMQHKSQKEVPVDDEDDDMVYKPQQSGSKEEIAKNSKPLFTKNYLEKLKLEGRLDNKHGTENSELEKIIVNIQNEDKCNVNESEAESEPNSSDAEDNSSVTADENNELNSSTQTKTSDDSPPEAFKSSSPPTKQQFIVTLDGVNSQENAGESITPTSTTNLGESSKSKKRAPSPIIFDKDATVTESPKKVPKMALPVVGKAKEQCKYWPNCRLGAACEFGHPTSPCKMFPQCKFGDRCLYVHPKCKFDAACTRKDCPYNHGKKLATNNIVKTEKTPKRYYVSSIPIVKELCKYYPFCENRNCPYFHPGPCYFGEGCLNRNECIYTHGGKVEMHKLQWLARK